MTRHRISRVLRLCLVLVVASLMVSCDIEGVTGPTVVGLGTVVDYLVHIVLTPGLGGAWIGCLSVDIPEGWTILSCDYEGMDADGEPFIGRGNILEPPFPPECEMEGWPPPPPGYVRGCIESQLQDQGPGWITATVRYDIGGFPGEYTLAFRFAADNPPYGYQTDEYYLDISVVESLVFADGFEYGDTLEWSATVP